MKNRKSTIPLKLRGEMALLPEYKQCMLYGHVDPKKGIQHECGGRITKEHAVTYSGNNIQEKWAIISICAKGHAVDEFQDAGTMNKEMNQWIAYNRATDAELLKYSSPAFRRTKVDEREALNKVYGPWQQKYPINDKPIMSPIQTAQKAFWYPLTGPEKQMIQKGIEFHREVYETHLTPFEMVRQMIDSYQILIDNFTDIIDVYPQLYTLINNPRQTSHVKNNKPKSEQTSTGENGRLFN